MQTTQSPVAIVTGASSGIGKSVARKLIEKGYRVHAAARRTDAMADLATLGARVHHLDLTKPESIDAFAAAVLAEGDRVDVLVNNAGYGFYGAVEEIPMAEARAQMDVNVFGLAHMTQLVLPSMRRRRSGRILNVTSIRRQDLVSARRVVSRIEVCRRGLLRLPSQRSATLRNRRRPDRAGGHRHGVDGRRSGQRAQGVGRGSVCRDPRRRLGHVQ
jgi:NAD(P)-dependent dehydrogenase (short-subunit alcohol dehydrogenase family)